MSQKQYKSHYEYLKNKWTDKHKELEKSLWEKHVESLNWLGTQVKYATVGSVGTFLLMATPVASPLPVQTPPPAQQVQHQKVQTIDHTAFLLTDLHQVLPDAIGPLNETQEKNVLTILQRDLGMKVAAEMNGIRLNQNYGYIGQEQHLMRYPGDTMDSHFDTSDQASQFGSTGMAPGRGAWGYFANSQADLTKLDSEREQYYIAVPTFLSTGYNEHTGDYSTFFKYRKMLVVNPDNGKTIVAVIGDSGPAPFTGKQLGGSPEVMKYLERVDGAQKGPVLYFFLDDPHDTIALGPVTK